MGGAAKARIAHGASRIKSIKGIVLIVCLVLALLGMILIWVGKGTSEAEDWCAIFTFIIVMLNCCVFFFDLMKVGPVSGVMMLAMINSLVTSPHWHDIRPGGSVVVIFGYIFMLIACWVSFIAFPIQFGVPKMDLVGILMIVTAVLLIVGNILLWIDEDRIGHLWYLQPIFLALMFCAGNIWNLQPAVELSFYGAALLFHTYFALAVGGFGGTVIIGGILCTIALVIMVALTITRISMSGVITTQTIKGIKFQVNVTAVTLIVAFVLVLIGCILTWVSKVGAVIKWCSIGSLITVILNMVIYWFGVFQLTPIAGCIAYGLSGGVTIAAGFGSLNTNMTFIDFLATSADAARRADQTVAVIGLALQIIAVVISFIIFKAGITFGKPNFKDKFNILVIIVAILLTIGNIFIWTVDDGAVYFSPLLLALLYIAGHLWGLSPAVDLTFFVPAYIVHGWWAYMVTVNGFAGVFGSLLINIALICMILVHIVKLTTNSGEAIAKDAVTTYTVS